jgi:hypothetical protein
MYREKTVFRQFAIPIAAFDYLKARQRLYHERNGKLLNNNELLVVLLNEHKTMTEESEEHGQTDPTHQRP